MFPEAAGLDCAGDPANSCADIPTYATAAAHGVPRKWIGDRLSPAGGGVARQSCGTADAEKARELHDRLKASLWDEVHLGKKPERTWKEAVLR
jgi:hypothetical protein